MKRCPQCARNYNDDSLSFCLDDGSELLFGPASSGTSPEPGAGGGVAGVPVATGPYSDDEPQTAILPDTASPGDAPTRAQINTTEQSSASLSGRVNESKKGPNTRLVLIVAVVSVVAVGVFVTYRYFDPSAKHIRSIAVLPFENASGDPDLDYLSEGVSESVIDRLSQLQHLKVIARSSSFKYKGQNPDIAEIAASLGVDAIVTGRMVPRGDSYQIRVELIDARENNHLWGETYTRPATDMQSLQRDITLEITENLRVRLSGEQSKRFTKQEVANPQAYELFLKGRFYLNKAGTPANFQKAVEYFEQAIVLDPNYAPAYAFLVETYSFGGITRGLTREQHDAKLESVAERALELDPDLAEAHNAMAGLKRHRWEWDKAERSYLKAIELNPNLPQAHSGYAFYLNLMGRDVEAIEHVLRARELDPVSLIINTSVGVIYYRTGRYDEAVAASKKAVQLGERAMFARRTLGGAYAAKGLFTEALGEYEEAIKIAGGESAAIQSLIGAVHVRMGQRAKAEEILNTIIAREIGIPPPELSVLYGALGRNDEAFAVLENAMSERIQSLPYIAVDPAYAELRSDPRFKDLLKSMGLPG